MTAVCLNPSLTINRIYAQQLQLDRKADDMTNIPKLKRIIVKDQALQHRINVLIRAQMRCDDNAIIEAIESIDRIHNGKVR